MKKICRGILAASMAVLSAAFIFTAARTSVFAAETSTYQSADGHKELIAVPTVAPVSESILDDTAVSRGLTAKYAGKTVSIIGDSISTYYGYIPNEYGFQYPCDNVQSVDLTWWKQVINATGMQLLVNASSSSTTVTGNSLDMLGQKIGCSWGRAAMAGAKGAPDVIFIMLGTNDLHSDRQPGTYYPGMPVTEGEVDVFADAYNLMLTKLQALYPNTQIICFTCLPRTKEGTTEKFTNSLGLTIESYNDVIKQVAAGHGCQVVDTWACGLDRNNASVFTYDYIHPNAEGSMLAAYWTLMTMN